MSLSHSPSIVTDGLVFYFDTLNNKAYSGSGINIYDLSQNNNNAIISGATYDSQQKYFNLDGINDTINFNYDLRTSWTYECWVLHNAVSGFSFLGQGGPVTNSGLHIWITNVNNNLRFGMYANDTDVFDLNQITNTGIWYMYTFTYDHNSPYTKQIYRNGNKLTEIRVQAQSQYIGTGIIRIGATYSSAGVYANGKISNAKLYNRILNENEIKQNYNTMRRRFNS